MKLNRRKIQTVFVAAGLALAGLLAGLQSPASAAVEAPSAMAGEVECGDRLTRCLTETFATEAEIRQCERDTDRCERMWDRCASKLSACESNLAVCELAPGKSCGNVRGAVEGRTIPLGIGDILDDLWELSCDHRLEVCDGVRRSKYGELQRCLADQEDCLDKIDICELDLEECQEDLADCREPAVIR